MTIALELAEWAVALAPTDEDLALARRSLVDTVAVTLAARGNPLTEASALLGEAGHWAAVGHVLDFDDLHMESTTHISVVVVPAVLATGGDARAYLAGAGVMARLGNALGWPHYAAGWHATCTAGAPGAAVAASVALGLDAEQTAHAIALAIPASGGVQRAFGTVGKPIQVGMAADAGVRAALLARAGVRTDLTVLESWLPLVGAKSASVETAGETIPGGLAIKLFPCCYAMQRPIGAIRALAPITPDDVESITITTPAGTVQPLIHHDPRTGLEGKFSLEYSLAAALLDDFPGFASFTDEAVGRPAARELVAKVVGIRPETDDDNLLAGEATVTVRTRDGAERTTALALPPGSPGLPASDAELAAKIASCGDDVPGLVRDLDWHSAAALLRAELPPSSVRVHA